MIYQFLDNNYFVRPLEEKDLDGSYPLWFQDQEITKYSLHGKFPKTKAYFQDYYNKLNTEDKIIWAICHKTDGHIGNMSLHTFFTIDRNAEFSILLGDRRHWGKGVALEASKRLLYHGFFKINLEKIHCGTAAGNEAMKKLALGLGMKQEGVRRNHLYIEGEWQDMIEYGMLKSEAQSLKKGF